MKLYILLVILLINIPYITAEKYGILAGDVSDRYIQMISIDNFLLHIMSNDIIVSETDGNKVFELSDNIRYTHINGRLMLTKDRDKLGFIAYDDGKGNSNFYTYDFNTTILDSMRLNGSYLIMHYSEKHLIAYDRNARIVIDLFNNNNVVHDDDIQISHIDDYYSYCYFYKDDIRRQSYFDDSGNFKTIDFELPYGIEGFVNNKYVYYSDSESLIIKDLNGVLQGAYPDNMKVMENHDTYSVYDDFKVYEANTEYYYNDFQLTNTISRKHQDGYAFLGIYDFNVFSFFKTKTQTNSITLFLSRRMTSLFKDKNVEIQFFPQSVLAIDLRSKKIYNHIFDCNIDMVDIDGFPSIYNCNGLYIYDMDSGYNLNNEISDIINSIHNVELENETLFIDGISVASNIRSISLDSDRNLLFTVCDNINDVYILKTNTPELIGSFRYNDLYEDCINRKFTIYDKSIVFEDFENIARFKVYKPHPNSEVIETDNDTIKFLFSKEVPTMSGFWIEDNILYTDHGQIKLTSNTLSSFINASHISILPDNIYLKYRAGSWKYRHGIEILEYDVLKSVRSINISNNQVILLDMDDLSFEEYDNVHSAREMMEYDKKYLLINENQTKKLIKRSR